MRQLLDVFERHGGPVLAVMRVPREEVGRYGVIAARGLVCAGAECSLREGREIPLHF
jgi:UTP-glucose-1-phosphate uridylyltransferase